MFCLYVFIYKYVNISTVVTVFNYNLTFNGILSYILPFLYSIN